MADRNNERRRREFDTPSDQPTDDDRRDAIRETKYLDDAGISQNTNSPFHFLSETPEFIKLIAASIFVAIVVQRLFFKGGKTNNYFSGSGNHTWNGGSNDNILGSDKTTHSREKILDQKASRERNYDKLNSSETQLLNDKPANNPLVNKSQQSKADPKKKRSNKVGNVAKRNYDKLISQKEADNSKSNNNASVDERRGTKRDDDESGNDNTQTQVASATPQSIQLHSKANHPGLTAYYNWLSVTTSLYRIYSIPSYSPSTSSNSTRNNDPTAIASTNVDSQTTFHPAILPMQPSSERGNVPVHLEVVNRTSHELIHVYWVDYKGNEIFKGSMRNGGGVWTQTTYIGHPWTFRVGVARQPNGEDSVLLKYVPFRIIPTVVGAETAHQEVLHGPIVGTQRFTLEDVPDDRITREGHRPVCFIEDPILPEPPLVPSSCGTSLYDNPWAAEPPMSTNEMVDAIQWSCRQIQREDAANPGRGLNAAKLLLKYLKNICLHPDDPKYRKLRTSNRAFADCYNGGCRGVLLALGFEEYYGFLEMGPSECNTLGYDRIRDVSDAMTLVKRAVEVMENGIDEANSNFQPEGSDGYGRAGFGHADGMNY